MLRVECAQNPKKQKGSQAPFWLLMKSEILHDQSHTKCEMEEKKIKYRRLGYGTAMAGGGERKTK